MADKTMSTGEAGRMGGEQTKKNHGHDFYVQNGQKGGQKGGQRVRELIEEGKQQEADNA
jgi:hypothetical protein